MFARSFHLFTGNLLVTFFCSFNHSLLLSSHFLPSFDIFWLSSFFFVILSLLSLHPTNLRSTTNCLITQSFIIQSHRIDSIRSHTPSSLCLCFISAVFLLRHCYSSIPLSPRSLIIYLSSVIARLFILHYSVSLHPPSVPPYLKQCCNYASSSHYRSVPLSIICRSDPWSRQRPDASSFDPPTIP